MLDLESVLQRRPIVVALAGPNGVGKTTFYEAFLSRTGLMFVNADRIASATGLEAYSAAELADAYRQALVEQRESFVFETVFSDPVVDKLNFLRRLEEIGYTVVLIFIGVASSAQSATRVAMRVAQGGHDVPDEKLHARYERTLHNLQLAFAELQNVLVYDNSDLNRGFVRVAHRWNGEFGVEGAIPEWLRPHLPSR